MLGQVVGAIGKMFGVKRKKEMEDGDGVEQAQAGSSDSISNQPHQSKVIKIDQLESELSLDGSSKTQLRAETDTGTDVTHSQPGYLTPNYSFTDDEDSKDMEDDEEEEEEEDDEDMETDDDGPPPEVVDLISDDEDDDEPQNITRIEVNNLANETNVIETPRAVPEAEKVDEINEGQQSNPDILESDQDEIEEDSASSVTTEPVGLEDVEVEDTEEIFVLDNEILDNEFNLNSPESDIISECMIDKRPKKIRHQKTKITTEKVTQGERKPAWHDSDDDISDTEGVHIRHPRRKTRKHGLYRQRLIEQFQLVHGIPAWSTKNNIAKNMVDSDNDEEEEESFLGKKRADKFQPLKPGQIKIVKVLNLNNEGHSSREFIRSIKFHPKSQVALVAGSSDIVSLYQVDGKVNSRIQTVKFDKLGLRNAIFAADGNEFYVSTPARGHFYSYDMISGGITQVKPNFSTRHETVRKLYASPNNEVLIGLGHHGNMYIYSRQSKEIIGTLTMNGEVQDITFDTTGSKMFSTGAFGEVYEWDMDRRQCVGKFQDEGTLMGTTIRLTSDYLVTGSDSGVVNLYEHSQKFSSSPTPVKSFMNLTTRVTSLETNHSGELLAFGSYEKRDVIKLAHVHSKSVYANFPFVNAHWGRPNTMAFSPNSGFFSFGNERGEAYLFRLTHFDNY